MLQENGDWTWEKFAEIAQMATRDEDGDGENDLWGLAIQGHNLYSPLILSNNANIINFDENGRAIYALDDPNAIEALQFFEDLHNNIKLWRLLKIQLTGMRLLENFQKAILPCFWTWLGRTGTQNTMKDDLVLYFSKRT